MCGQVQSGPHQVWNGRAPPSVDNWRSYHRCLFFFGLLIRLDSLYEQSFLRPPASLNLHSKVDILKPTPVLYFPGGTVASFFVMRTVGL